MLDRFRASGGLGSRKRKFRFKNKLLSLDSTTISLCLNLFPWATFRRAKGGVKVHVLLDHDDYMPSFALITDARRHDRTVARRFTLKPGSIIAFDRAYNDYTLFSQWTQNGIYFVTRLKKNAAYHIVENRPIPQNRAVLADQIVELTGHNATEKCPHQLCRVVVWDDANNRMIELLTNHLGFGASTIADIYKDRWEIEIFFKTLKQHLKVKTFIGTSENALRIQIWTALIALLLLKYLHHLSTCGWSMSNLATMLRLNLFTYRDLRKWLDDPYGQPPTPAVIQQRLPGFGQPIAG
jgi:hypothetical protein